MRIPLTMLTRPFVAALVLSSAAHAAIALIASDAAPSSGTPSAREVASSQRPALLVALSSPRSSRIEPVPPPARRAVASPAAVAASPAQSARRRVPSSEIASVEPAQNPDETFEPPTRPTPLTYPVLPLPPGDDPHIVGLVRMLLVVAGDGKVVKTIVTAATLPQDYIDLVTKSFEEMEFKPGRLRGIPHTGWYEVVVNFDFEPQAAPPL